jgi:hypothetical protein
MITKYSNTTPYVCSNFPAIPIKYIFVSVYTCNGLSVLQWVLMSLNDDVGLCNVTILTRSNIDVKKVLMNQECLIMKV